MNFNYGFEPQIPFHGPAYERYVRYGYSAGTPTPKIEVIEEAVPPTHPLCNQASLSARLFADGQNVVADPLQFAADRARIGKEQVRLMLDQLAARHAINYVIQKDIQYTECRIGAQLDEIMERPSHLGNEGRFEGDLLKQLEQLKKERRAEDVSCWRDSTRILSDICDRWTDYADESRKARLMDFDL